MSTLTDTPAVGSTVKVVLAPRYTTLPEQIAAVLGLVGTTHTVTRSMWGLVGTEASPVDVDARFLAVV